MIFMNNNLHTLIHFGADNFNSLAERTEAENKAKSIYTNTFAAYE